MREVVVFKQSKHSEEPCFVIHDIFNAIWSHSIKIMNCKSDYISIINRRMKHLAIIIEKGA